MRPANRSKTFRAHGQASLIIAAAALACIAAPPALAQMQVRVHAPQPRTMVQLQTGDESPRATVPNSGRSFDELVAALDAPSLSVRQLAHAELSERTDITIDQLETALARPDLTPEQTTRLDAAARDRFIDGPRAAMGISWNPDVQNRASIMGTIPGFDADNKLERGDIFIAVADQPIRGGNAQRLLRWQIISRDPGEIMPVTVRRGKDLLTFDLLLGSYEQLGDGRGVTSPQDFAAAYRLRENRLGRIADGDALGLTADDWSVAREEGNKRFLVQLQQRRSGGQPVLVAGGAPRQGPDDDREDYRRAAARGKTNPMRISPAVRFGLADPMERMPTRQISVHDEIRDQVKKIDTLRKEVQNPGDESRRPGIGVVPGQNAMLIRASAEERLAAAERVLEALRAEAAETGELVEKNEK